MNQTMVENKEPEVFIDLNNGEYLQFDMTLPIQILFDNVMNFVSKTDFEWLKNFSVLLVEDLFLSLLFF